MLKIAEARCHRCQGSGHHPVAPRQHGLFEELRGVRRIGPAGADARAAACSGLGVEMRTETIDRPDSRRAWATVRASGCPEKGNAGERRRPRRAISSSRSMSNRTNVPARGRRFPHRSSPIGVHEAALGAQDRRAGARRHGAAARAAGHADRPALSHAGAGAPSPRSGERGDLVVEVKIVLPKVLDERSKELLREFGRINGWSRRRQDRGTR